MVNARSSTSELTDESQKENSGIRDKRSPAKPGSSKVKKEKEALKISKATRVISGEEDDEEGYEQSQPNGTSINGHGGGADEEADTDEGESEGEEGSHRGRKRVRTNALGDSVPSLSQVEPKEERRVTLPRDDDGFIPGSIVRVQFKNFVTYDHVEFFPGSHLNMILGPNGTGKSTIACGICLGLNFPPSVLGRASEISSFVKNGTTDGFIEIELKGPKGKPNLVIKRTLTSRAKTSQFFINKKVTPAKEVSIAISRLNIQVSNLCSFLPQDKVAEFARMSPQQLLKETQRAAGNENLTHWHDILITAGKELKQLQETVKADKDQLKTMEERNATLERDVRRYEERLQIQKRVDLLELLHPFMEYMEEKRKYDDAKVEHKAAHNKVLEIKEKQAPVTARKNAMDRQHKALEQQRDRKKTDMKKQFDAMRTKWTKSEALEAEGDDLKTKLDGLKTREKTRLAEIKKLEKSITELQHRIDNPPEIEDIEMLQTEIRKLKTDNRQLNERQRDLQDKQKACIEEEAKQKRAIGEYNHRLKQLEDVNHRKFEHLAKEAKDCAEAVEWIRKNRERFQMEVLEPPVLSMNIPDQRYAKAVEACFSQNQLRTIVTQCEEDYQLLNKMLTDSPDGVGRRLRLNTWYRSYTPDKIAPPPMSPEELASCGFDGYALDFVDCPEPLKFFLQSDINLHRTAVGLNGHKVDGPKATELVSRGRGGGCNFIAGDVMNTVIRSRYGQQLAQNTTREIRQPRYFAIAAVDPEAKREAQRNLAEAQERLKVNEEKAGELAKEESELRKESAEFKKKHDALEKRKDTSRRAQDQLVRFGIQLDENREKLKAQQNAPSVDKERVDLKRRILAVAKKRAELVKDYDKLIRVAIQDQIEATRLGLQFLQVSANRDYAESLCQDQKIELDEAMETYHQVRERFEKAKLKSKQLLTTSKALLDEANAETRDRFAELEQSGEANAKTSEQWRTELEEEKEKLDSTVQTHSGVVETYRKRLQEINDLTETIEDREEKLKKKERQIQNARNNWEPALRELVESVGDKFSTAFDRIGCAGEIKISEHEDYDKWAIDILVKFRDSEKLQLLTGERQSGGERSLTTILYLMSLTEEARTPFSLVDEINQGMDARAERAVHNSLVQVTCKKDSGQYFLITPKLLPDLVYHERMKILCVNNGEWLPEDPSTKVGDLMGLISNFVQRNAHSQASA